MSKPRVVAFIQARLTSARLPNKVLAKIGEWTALELMLKRLEPAKSLEQIVLLIPDTQQNDRLAEYIKRDLKLLCFRGSEHDVLSRYSEAAKSYPADYYVRLTADCPLICHEIVDEVVNRTIQECADYGSNINPPTFPDGFDVECISSRALEWSEKNISNTQWREHVTMGLRECDPRTQDLKFLNVSRQGESVAHLRLTLDTPEDLKMLNNLAAVFGGVLPSAEAHQIEKAAIYCLKGK
jgi:glutamate-1-semialdehyde 2,1-aminomutase